MLEKILDAILDPQPAVGSQGVQQAPADPGSWLDDIFNNGWMAHGPFGDGSSFDDLSIYDSSLDWILQF